MIDIFWRDHLSIMADMEQKDFMPANSDLVTEEFASWLLDKTRNYGVVFLYSNVQSQRITIALKRRLPHATQTTAEKGCPKKALVQAGVG